MLSLLFQFAIISSNVDTRIWLHHSKKFNLSVYNGYHLKNLELSQRKEIVCFVATTPSSRLSLRSVIRRTWGKILKPLFVMQNAADDSTRKFLRNEAEVFNDMIVIDDDTELSFDEKSFVALKFFRDYFTSSQYIMIVGDNVMINTEHLYEMLNELKESKIVLPPTKFNYKSLPMIASGMHTLKHQFRIFLI